MGLFEHIDVAIIGSMILHGICTNCGFFHYVMADINYITCQNVLPTLIKFLLNVLLTIGLDMHTNIHATMQIKLQMKFTTKTSFYLVLIVSTLYFRSGHIFGHINMIRFVGLKPNKHYISI